MSTATAPTPIADTSRFKYDLDHEGYQQLPPRPAIYVDPAAGNDDATGNDPANPVRTLDRAKHLSNGQKSYAIKRGTVVSAGGSPLELKAPNLGLFSYGNPTAPRPVFALGPSKYGVIVWAPQCDVVDMDFRDDRADATSASVGVVVHDKGSGFMLENNRFDGLYRCLNVMGGPTSLVRGGLIRRNVMRNAWRKDGLGYPCGIYSDYTDGLRVVNNLLDMIGWMPGRQDPNQHSHGMYLDGDGNTTPRVDVVNNIVSRAGGCGVQGRPGGFLEQNLFVDNGQQGVDAFLGHIVPSNCLMRMNVVTDTKNRQGIRGYNGLCNNSRTGILEYNIAVHAYGDRNGGAFELGNPGNVNILPTPDTYATFRYNVAHDWSSFGIQIDAPRGELTIDHCSLTSIRAKCVNMRSNSLKYFGSNNWYSAQPGGATVVTPDNHAASADEWAARYNNERFMIGRPNYKAPNYRIEQYIASFGCLTWDQFVNKLDAGMTRGKYNTIANMIAPCAFRAFWDAFSVVP